MSRLKYWLKLFFIFILLVLLTPSYANIDSRSAITQTIAPNELENFNNYPLKVKQLIEQALKLAGKNLTYTYGSASPSYGGMDCSGTIFYLLSNEQIKDVPRSSDQMYSWVWKEGNFYAVISHNIQSFEFKYLKPGDLLFWSGTYNVHRDLPVTHVMLYLGKNSKGEKLMFGASDGRTYQNKTMWGVSVFDFKLPKQEAKSRFLGYSCVPTLTC